jgi:hypothetical protein
MSYMRGQFYIWSDGDHLHLDTPGAPEDGLLIPQDIADDYAVMRFAQLIEKNQVSDVIARALERWTGNFGCVALNKLASELSALKPHRD